MKLLITGFPGWFANRLIETLEDYPGARRIERIRCLSQTKLPPPASLIPVEIFEGDLMDLSSLQKAVAGMDLVLHAAAVLHVRRNQDFYRINRDGTRNLLAACEAAGIKRFLYISSNAAQGFCAGRGHELVENEPCLPESHYGKSKLAAELAVEEYFTKKAFETVIVRPAMFYGPPVPERHLGIYKKIARGTFPVFGSGDYLRSITYIDNLIQGIHLALHHPKAIGQTYYIADKAIPTLNDIIRSIADAMSVNVKIVHYPAWLAAAAEKLDSLISAFDGYWMLPHIVGESCKNIACRITKAEQELGYQPTVSFREGYPRTIEWCRRNNLL